MVSGAAARRVLRHAGVRGADARGAARIAGITVVGVVTQPDRPRGRGQKLRDAPVKALALAPGCRCCSRNG